MEPTSEETWQIAGEALVPFERVRPRLACVESTMLDKVMGYSKTVMISCCRFSHYQLFLTSLRSFSVEVNVGAASLLFVPAPVTAERFRQSMLCMCESFALPIGNSRETGSPVARSLHHFPTF